MGQENQLLETTAEETASFVFIDITRVDKDDINQPWKRVHMDEVDKWRNKMIELESRHCYATVQRFAKGLHTPGSNESYISPLYFDLDSDDGLQKSLDDARRLKDYLYAGLGAEEGVEFFFSGNRGFHITIAAELCGFEPSSDLARICKFIAVHIADKLTLNTFDANVYSKRRMWRMVNTKHGKSGLWKIQLTPTEIGTLSIDDIKDLATGPREIEVDI